MARRVLIVGGGYAGAICANRLARKSRAEITLVNAQPWFVERIRLHQDAAGAGPRRQSLAAMLRGTGARLRVGMVSEIDLGARRARCADGQDEPFDDLVLATGSIGNSRGIPGLAHAWSCATEDRALALRARLATFPGGRVVIVGGGLTGIELATELGEERPDLRLTLVTGGDVAFMLGASARQHVRRTLERLHVTLREETRVVAIDEDAVVLASGEAPSDVTVWCGGLEATPLARDIGLDVDDSGRAIVDATLRSASHDFVRVIGDAARVTGADGRALRMACATALPQGAFTADALARELRGERAERDFSLAYAIQCLSLGRRDGLVQHVDAFDAPKRAWVKGRTGAFLKEMVCRYPVTSIALERYGIGYSWPHGRRLDARARAELIARSP